MDSAFNLGVDFGYGKSRLKCGKNTTRRSRMKAARKRKGRLHVLKKILGGNRAMLIAASGVLPAATYGAAISGFSDHELLQLRRIAAASMNPSAKGRSLSALLLLHGDPTWTAAVAPILQGVRAGWNAAQDEASVGRGIT